MTADLPDDIVVRAPTLDDAEAVSDLINAYAVATVGAAATNPDKIQHFFQTPGLDPSRDVWLATTTDGRPVAFADVVSRAPHVRAHGDGYVHPEFQGRGLGLALLRHAFRAFAARGLRKVGLDVDAASPTGATRLYERAGMRALRQFDRYEKELRSGREPAPQPAQL
ncbi:MAG TPA: GNAT family N-acetyltransferase [Ktedonobacterales bacterium]|jgi:ribosomal protein S18 acetylase RimI-like enzyme